MSNEKAVAVRRVEPGGHRRVRWNAGLRDGFLDHLAATCNIMDAARAIGVSPQAVHRLRRRDKSFADAWSEAVALGYETLETRLIAHALAGGTDDRKLADGDDPTLPPIEIDLALKLLTTHRNATHKPRRGGPRAVYARQEDTDATLMRRLATIEAHRSRERAAPLLAEAEQEKA